MKKLFFVGAVALFGAINAQVTYGVKAGANFASISNIADDFGDGVKAKPKVGFHAGVFANIPVASSFSVQPELLYNQAGSKLTADGESMTYNLDYLAVPIMGQYNIMPNLYLEAGPQFGFLLSSKTKYDGETEDIDKDYINSFDFGLGIGAGYYIIPNLGVSVRYVASFTEVPKDNESDTKFRNGVFQVGLNYKFGKK